MHDAPAPDAPLDPDDTASGDAGGQTAAAAVTLAPAAAKRALTVVFLTILLDVVGLGLVVPVIPDLIRELGGGSLADASAIGGWLGFTYAALQFVCAPILGGLSDRFGRRPVLLLALVGFGLDYLVQGLAPTLAWLFVGRAIAGMTGASFTVAAAYIADVTPPERRSQNFGLIGAAFGLGFIVGPALGGILGSVSPRLPFFVAAALALANAAAGFFFLPESLDRVHRRPFAWRRANPVGSFAALGRIRTHLGFVAGLFLLQLAGHALQSTWSFSTMERFGWTQRDVGMSLAFVGVVVAVVQGGLARRWLPRLGEARAVRISLGLYLVGMLAFAFATKGWMMYAIMIPYGLAGLAGPALQGLVSAAVPASGQGELQGALTGLTAVANVIGPPLMTGLFTHFAAANAPVYFPGAPFAMGAVLIVGIAIAVLPPLARGVGTRAQTS